MARTVLLADDSVTAQNMGRRILMDAGYEVVTVNNGSAALKRIHESKPDLIVLDVYMPGYGGLEVCQRLKESGETMKIPVLLTVGKMEPFKADEAKRVRADGHIVKPFEASELLAALTRLEDRIVPQAESPAVRRGKPENKTRLWHAEDPLAEFAQLPTEQITYLAEVKKRQLHSEPAAEPLPPVHQESSSAAAAGALAASAGELATASALLGPSSAGAPPAPPAEFTVQESAIPSPVAGQDESAPTEFQAADPVAELPVSSEESLEEAAKASVPVAPAEPPAVPADMASGPVSAPRWVAENVPLTAEEASITLEAEMQQAQAVSSATIEPETLAHAQSSSSHPTAAQMPPEPGTENPSEASFAAAASAVVSSQQSAVGPQPMGAREEDTVPVPESEPQIPSEAAAAWENWRQIRDSVMSPQKAAAIAGSVAEMAQAVASAEDSSSKPDPAPSEGAGASIAAAVEEDNSIASIVDSVLADLKPRLMEEIAKKLAAKKS